MERVAVSAGGKRPAACKITKTSSTTSVTVKGSPARTLGANLKNYDVGIELTTPAETFLECDENIPSCVRVLARPSLCNSQVLFL